MPEIQYLSDTALATPIDDGVALADGDRAAGDFENDAEQDLFATAYLQVQFDTTAPAAGEAIAELYVLPGDGEATEVFPNGGDAGLGQDVDPQPIFLAGVFTTVSPSTGTDEVVAITGIPLGPDGNRIVIKNISGDTFDLTWELRLKPYKIESI